MSPKILIMGSSRTQNQKPGVMPALFRFNSLRWQILREQLQITNPQAHSLRILVLTTTAGFISVNQPITYSPYVWTGSTWKKDRVKIHSSYQAVVRPRIDPQTKILVCAEALQQSIIVDCGLQQDVVSRGALLTMMGTTGQYMQQLRTWISERTTVNG